jgi:lipopolysaccharide/colanic/teichoic acid biosynthesis glycosyltransferase
MSTIGLTQQNIPNYSLRLLMKPGITGWAQISCGYANSLATSREKLKYDLFYIVNQFFLLDLVVLLKTINVVLFGKGT